MLTEIYIEAVLVDEKPADQVWEARIDENVADSPPSIRMVPYSGDRGEWFGKLVVKRLLFMMLFAVPSIISAACLPGSVLMG